MSDLDTSHAIRIGTHLAQRLQASLDTLGRFHPFDATRVTEADIAVPDATDAFLKRLENLVNHIQDQVWRRIVVDEGFRDPAEMSRRDIAELMEKITLLPSVAEFREVVRLRNRLSHVYPDDPERQARRLNEAFAASTLLFECMRRAEAWLARRLTPPASP